MRDCVTAAAASLGPYDCVMLSGLWPTAWLLLLLHWGRLTAFCVRDYGRLRDCCCCLIGAVWRRSVFGTMGDCVTAAAASLGPYDCDMLFGLWATAWLLLLHWGRMTALFCLDYGRLRDCCCCFIGAVWLRYVGWTYVGCVTAAAACDVSGMLAKTGHHCGADPGADAADIGTEAVWPHNWWLTAVRTAWLLLLSQWGQPDGRVLYGNRENIVRGAATAWVMLLPAWHSLCAVCCLVCVTDAAAALGAGRVGSVGDNCTGVKLLLTHCACSCVPHAAAALCSRIWWNFRVRRFGVDLSWRIDRASREPASSWVIAPSHYPEIPCWAIIVKMRCSSCQQQLSTNFCNVFWNKNIRFSITSTPFMCKLLVPLQPSF